MLLGWGSSVRLPRPFTPLRSGLKTDQSVIRASEVMRDETAVETSLPLGTGVVMILLDRQDADAAANGDFGIAADGATLTTPPLRIRRRKPPRAAVSGGPGDPGREQHRRFHRKCHGMAGGGRCRPSGPGAGMGGTIQRRRPGASGSRGSAHARRPDHRSADFNCGQSCGCYRGQSRS